MAVLLSDYRDYREFLIIKAILVVTHFLTTHWGGHVSMPLIICKHQGYLWSILEVSGKNLIPCGLDSFIFTLPAVLFCTCILLAESCCLWSTWHFKVRKMKLIVWWFDMQLTWDLCFLGSLRTATRGEKGYFWAKKETTLIPFLSGISSIPKILIKH